MTAQTPAERLLAAADLLDKRAAEATASPWRAKVAPASVYGPEEAEVMGDYRAEPSEGILASYQEVARGVVDDDDPDGPWLLPGDARYIATMHPEVGKGIAILLRAVSTDLASGRAALAVADQLLAGESS
jgi:hypothetical protein